MWDLRWSLASVFRQAEHALANDVALNLRGPSTDRVGEQIHVISNPLAAVDGAFIADIERRVLAEQRCCKARDVEAVLGVEELVHHRYAARPLFKSRSTDPPAGQREGQFVGPDAHDLIAHSWVLGRRRAIDRDAPREVDDVF